jgi:predicted nucleotidyltransferase
MNRDDMVEVLQQQGADLRQQFGVQHLSLFGSVARHEATAESDIDLLVEFVGPATFDRYMDLKFFLEELLQCRVDLVTEAALRPQIKSAIEKELIRVT